MFIARMRSSSDVFFKKELEIKLVQPMKNLCMPRTSVLHLRIGLEIFDDFNLFLYYLILINKNLFGFLDQLLSQNPNDIFAIALSFLLINICSF